MKVYENVFQGSEEWENLRRGRATASQFDRIITAKGKPSAAAQSYVVELIADTLYTGNEFKFQGNRFTDWGTMYETNARHGFKDLTGLQVREVGFCVRDCGIIGASPDGLIVDGYGCFVGGLELKCPAPKTHIGYLLENKLPDEYKLQVHGGMAVTGFDHWYFSSYFPGLKQLIVRVDRDEFTDQLCGVLDDFVIQYAAIKSRVMQSLEIQEQ